MIARTIAATLLVTIASSYASPPETSRIKRWNPASAVAEAERDIAAGRIRFAYIGGYVSHAPGLPSDPATLKMLEGYRYRRLEVGPQGCIQDEHSFERAEYARRYNQVMWSHVSKRR